MTRSPSRKQLLEDCEGLRFFLGDRIARVDELKAEVNAKDAELAALRAELAASRLPRRLARASTARIAPMRKAG